MSFQLTLRQILMTGLTPLMMPYNKTRDYKGRKANPRQRWQKQQDQSLLSIQLREAQAQVV